jgi:hypothetical protein
MYGLITTLLVCRLALAAMARWSDFDRSVGDGIGGVLAIAAMVSALWASTVVELLGWIAIGWTAAMTIWLLAIGSTDHRDLPKGCQVFDSFLLLGLLVTAAMKWGGVAL